MCGYVYCVHVLRVPCLRANSVTSCYSYMRIILKHYSQPCELWNNIIFTFYLQAPTQSSWSKIAASNKPPPTHQQTNSQWGPSTQSNPSISSYQATHMQQQQQQQQQQHVSPQKEEHQLSFWDECALETATTTSTTTTTSSSNSTSRTGKGKNRDEPSGVKTSSKGAAKKKEEVRTCTVCYCTLCSSLWKSNP